MIDAECLETNSGKAAELLAVMGNQKRMLILCHLAQEGEMQVGVLAGKVELSQSALSQHLAKLRNQDLVKTRRQAQTIYYSIKSPSVLTMLQTLNTIFCA